MVPESGRSTVGLMDRAEQYAELDAERAERWLGYGKWEREYFPKLLGLHAEVVKQDFCRMRLVFKPSLEQPAGVVHGGAIASLIDSVVVPAIGSAYEAGVNFVTIDLHIQFLGALVGEDALAEGWVVQRGRSMVFVEAEVIGADSGRLIARGQMTYKVSLPRH